MPITYFMEQYHVGKNWGGAEVNLQGTLLSEAVFNHLSGADYIRSLEKAGISYRKTNMYEDFNRASSIEWSRDYPHANRANRFFNSLTHYQNVVKERTGTKPSLEQARDFYKKWKTATFKTTEEAKDATRMEEEDDYPGTP